MIAQQGAGLSAGTRWLLRLVVLFCLLLILYPTMKLALGSFIDSPTGDDGPLSLVNYRDVLDSRHLGKVAWNTIWVAATSAIMGLVAGSFMAWLVARTDVPFRRTIEMLAMLPFLIPGSLAAIGWAVLGNPDIGTLNLVWRWLTGSDGTLVNLYSYWGVSFVFAQHGAGFVYLMAVSSFRNSDPSFEEAARLSGAGPWRAAWAIQLPMIAPVLVPLGLMTFIRAVESFEIPVILGTPAKVFVLTNEIYYLLKTESPPLYGQALALACMITLALGAMMAFERFLTGRRSHVSITGKGYQPRIVALRPWARWLCLALAGLFALASSILPLGTIVFSSFFRTFGLYEPSGLTMQNYAALLADEVVPRAMANTILLAIGAATLCLLLGSLAAYALQRQMRVGRNVAEGLMMIPWAMPGLVFGLALLWAYIAIPGIYGSLLILLIAYVTFGIPIALRAMGATLGQLSGELEDAARVHGGNFRQTLMEIVLPLARPGLIAGWFVLATIFSRELAASVLLYGPGSEVLSVTLLGFWERGRGSIVMSLSVLMMLILAAMYLAERLLRRGEERMR